MDNQEEKVIEYLSQHKNILWTGIVVLAGGLVGLVLTYDPELSIYSFNNLGRIIFILIGSTLLFSMVTGLINTDLSIRKIFNKKGGYYE